MVFNAFADRIADIARNLPAPESTTVRDTVVDETDTRDKIFHLNVPHCIIWV
jgi:hypothetical protein